jgi:hypothetical protein
MDNDTGDQPSVVRNYLQNWQKEHNIADGTPVCVIQRQGLQDAFDESDMLRRWGA